MLTFKTLICLLGAAQLCIVAENSTVAKKDSDGVYVLTDSNFKQFVQDNDAIYIDFYAPWCSTCKQLTPGWAEVAQFLHSETEIKVAKVDATVNEDAADEFDITNFPTIKLVRKDIVDEYEGAHLETQDLIDFVEFKTGPPAIRMNSLEAFKDVRDNQQVFVLGIFDSDDSIAAQKYRDAGKKFQKPRFYYTTEQTVADEVGAIGTGGISIVKQYDDLRTPFEGRDKWSTKDLMDFIEASWAPTVIEYTDESAHAIFKSNLKTQCLLFASRKNLEGFQECFSRIANEHKDEILFISVAVDDTELGVGSIVDYYAIKGEDPTLRIVNGDSKQRYIPDVTLTCETMENFVVDYLNGEVQSECEKPPPGWDQQPVKVLNDANYYEVAHDKSTYSFVFFYALWDPKSKGFQGKWEILAEYFEGDEEIVLAKMDYSNSAIEDYPVRQFPTLVLFGKDTNAYYEYAGKRDLGHLKKWIAEVRKGAIEETTPVKPQGKKQPDTAETDPNPTEENNVRDEGQHTAQHAEL